MKTSLFFRKPNGKLGGATTDHPETDIMMAQQQEKTKQTLKGIGHEIKPKTPVLCLIVN